MKRQDHDLKKMTIGALRREVMKCRSAIRKHRDADGNARCFHNDQELYRRTLPERKRSGRMRLSVKAHLRKCKGYITRQKCSGNCPIMKAAQRKR